MRTRVSEKMRSESIRVSLLDVLQHPGPEFVQPAADGDLVAVGIDEPQATLWEPSQLLRASVGHCVQRGATLRSFYSVRHHHRAELLKPRVCRQGHVLQGIDRVIDGVSRAYFFGGE